MKHMTRRSFLKSTLYTGAALGLPARSWAQVAGANEDIRIAVVGFGGRGGDHIQGYSNLRKNGEKVRIVGLCDVDKDILSKVLKSFNDRGEEVAGFTDIRQLLEHKNVDAISIATPNHWHALATIWACQAGKDVYVEKPISHNVWEGRKAVEAARKYQRIVQAGTQSRSSDGLREAVEWVRAGNLGKITTARGLCYKRRKSIGKVDAPVPVPSNIDYDLWCGPAPKLPLSRGRLHYDWHWVWSTGNGDLGNQGIHQMDIARWFLGVNELSPRVFSVGGRLGYVDDGETPNTQIVYHAYAAAPLIFEVRGLAEKTGSDKMDKYKGGSVAVIIDCENGYVLVPNYSKATAYDKSGTVIKEFEGAKDHYANFLNAMRSRKTADLNADILEGHLSSALCHTGNISYRLGAEKSPEEIREQIRGDREAKETFDRMTEHLAANDVDLNKTKATLGPVLKMDPKAERFLGNAKANEFLTREYREPFVVPQMV
jgi:predicted dehydrogenase